MRYAGVAMCSVFLVGLLALPFAPETQGSRCRSDASTVGRSGLRTLAA